MNRQQFNSRNNIGQVLTFQKSGATNSFDPQVTFATGSRRVSWKLNNGIFTEQIAGNDLIYSGFSSDTAIRDVEVRVSNFDNISNLTFSNDNLFGTLDLRILKSWGTTFPNIGVSNNPNLTRILNPEANETFSNYQAAFCNLTGNLDLTPMSGAISSFIVNNNSNLTGITNSVNLRVTGQYVANSCNLTGNLNIPFTGLSPIFQVAFNPNLTGITHAVSTNNFSQYLVNNNNLTGNLDLTPLSNFGGNFTANNNPNLTSVTILPTSNIFVTFNISSCNLTGGLDMTIFPNLGNIFSVNNNVLLTGITHTPSPQNFNVYQANNCGLTGNLSVPFTGLGGSFTVQVNPNLTSITHVPSSRSFSQYIANSCNLTDNLNLPLSGLGGSFQVYSNPNLTGITHVQSTQNINSYVAYSCNLTGNLDLPFSGLGGSFQVQTNPNLTGLTHIETFRNFSVYLAYDCNLTGTLDITNLKNFGALSGQQCYMNVSNNPNLTNISYPTTNGFFRNASNIEAFGVFGLYSCNLDYVDFKPLSGATLLTGATQGNPRISLRDNNMSAGDVNHILVDFSGNTTVNPSGWSNVNLNIGGSNADPDSSSGGFDGLAAIAFLTGSPYNWTITY
jgi:hypothetical protein